MPKVYAIDGITPVVHPSAVLIGDVIVSARVYIGPRGGREHPGYVHGARLPR